MTKHRTLRWWGHGLCALALLTLYGCPQSWSETYRYDKLQPYDTYALYELLEARPEGLKMLSDSLGTLQLEEMEHANYVYVGKYAYYSDRSVTELLNFVEKGNTAFISTYSLPQELATYLYGDDCYYEWQDQYDSRLYTDTVYLDLNGGEDVYPIVHVYDNEPQIRSVPHIPIEFMCDDELGNRTLGYADTTYINFVELPWGEGKFYFLSTPLYLTNYYLDDDEDYAYAESLLAGVIGPGPVYWDEFSQVPAPVAQQRQRARNQQGQGSRGGAGRSLLSGNETLRYIQEQKELSFAWYTLLFAVLLFIAFRGKRRQRVIPVIRRRENSSQRFIDTMARLIFQKGAHGKLARQELASLRFHLQEKWGIRWKDGEDPPTDLAALMGIDETVAQKALTEIRVVQNMRYFDEVSLIRFYRSIEPLYKV